MSATGLEAFDRTLQKTHIWLDEIAEVMDVDRQRAYHAMRAVLHALRDRLPIAQAAHLGAQLPLLVRGIYYDEWSPQPKPTIRTRDQFVQRVEDGLGTAPPLDVMDAIEAVFSVLDRHVTEGEMNKVRGDLPKDILTLWPQA